MTPTGTATHDHELREHLRKLLASGEAHITNQKTLSEFPREKIGQTIGAFEHTAWQLLEHMRIAQHDILDFSRNPQYRERKWPDDYWPKEPSASSRQWEESVKGFFRDLEAMQALIADPANDLFAKIAWGKGQTLLREAMLVADHNSYHLGQIAMLHKALTSS